MFQQRCVACADSTKVQRFDRLSCVVDYFRCKTCGHAWAVHKSDPTVIDHFGPLPKKLD